MRSFRFSLYLSPFFLFSLSCGPSGGSSPLPLFAAIFQNPNTEYIYTEPACVYKNDFFGYKNTDPMQVLSDPSGNIYVVGETFDNLGGKNPTNDRMPFVMKFASSGSCREWITMLMDSPGGQLYGGAGIDSDGNTYITGLANGNVGGETCAVYCRFLTKVDSNGNFIWTKFHNYNALNSLYVDSSGNSYLVGITSNSINGQSPTGTNDAFIVKYDKDGNIASTILLGASGKLTSGSSVTTDTNGNIYLSGVTFGSLGGQPIPNGGNGGVFIAKYDPSFSFQWSRNYPMASSSLSFLTSTTDPTGNIYLGGNRSSPGAIDGISVYGSNNPFVAKFDTSGTKQWTKAFGYTDTSTQAVGIAFATDRIYIFGNASGNTAPIQTTGITDIFFNSYDSSGNSLGLSLLGYPNKYVFARSLYFSGSGTLHYSFGVQDPKSLNIQGKIDLL